jgi:hypothetical protein
MTPIPNENFSSDLKELTNTVRQLIRCMKDREVVGCSNDLLVALKSGDFDYYLLSLLLKSYGFSVQRLDATRIRLERENKKGTATFVFDASGQFDIALKSNKKELDIKDEWLLCFDLKFLYIYKTKNVKVPDGQKDEVFRLRPHQVEEYQILQFGDVLL